MSRIAQAVAIAAVMFLCMFNCGQVEVDNMAGLPSVPVTWPLAGGLDSATAPIVQQPGTFLQLDDVTQERAGEWRNRYGFTQVAADTLPNGVAPLIGKLGDAGMFALNEKLATCQPSLTSNRWNTSSAITVADDISRVPVMTSDSPIVGFAQAGNLYIVASLDSVAPAVAVFDAQGKTHAKIALTPGLYIRARCAATAGKLVAYLASTAGNLVTYVVDVGTGVVTGPATIKAGTHVTAPYLDALWDGTSANITVVVRLAAADAVRFMEHNPATGALATDVSLTAIVANSALSLFQNFSAGGNRYVGTSDSTGPTTRVLKVTSAGVISVNDLVPTSPNAVAVSITGVAYNADTFWTCVYQVPANLNHVYVAYRDGSGVHIGGSFLTGSVIGTDSQLSSLDGQAWSFDGVNLQVLMGVHGEFVTDPQDSWYMVSLPLVAFAGGNEQSRITPLQAQAYMAGAVATQSALFQRAAVSAHVSAFALPVLASYSLTAGVASRQYSIDVFRQQILGTADIATAVNHGPPIQYKQTSYVPGNSAAYIDEGNLQPIGTSSPPPALLGGVQATGGGALTLLTTYQVCMVIEVLDSDGNVWRSPPSLPVTYTLTGTNNQIAFNATIAPNQNITGRWRVKTYRTSANGFVFRLTSTRVVFGAGGLSLIYTENASDTTIAASEVLYTTGETATAITPRASHLMTAKDRLWLVNADFRTEVWYSKNLRPGRQPEFTNGNVIDIDDNYGDITGLSTIDDNLVVFKRNAIYFVNGDGFADDGSGTNVSTVMVSGDVGAIPGSPIVQAGDAIYFVSDRGIYSIDRGGNVVFVGQPVDRYVNQPLVQTPERIWDGVYVPSKNEVRFVTDNYILVHNRKFATTATLTAVSTGAYWCRWNFAGGRRALVINNQMVVIKSDGTVWREGDQNQLTDQGAAINGVIRSAWIRPQGLEGFLRLRRMRLVGTRTAGGGNISPTMQIYFDNIDSAFEGPFAPQAAIGAGTSPVVAEAMPRQHRCSAFSVQVNFPAGDNTYRLSGWTALVAAKQGIQKNVGTSGRWQ